MLFRLWTLKEAYLKAIGTGLGTPLKSFAFAFEPIRIAFEPGKPDHPAAWQFAILPALTNTSFRSPPGTILMSCA